MWRSFLALGFGLALALALDQAARLVIPEDTEAEGRWYLRTVQYHPILGWAGYPGFAETNDGIVFRTNSLGYRDREPGDEPGDRALRVLFLGDSFTWGDEVRDEDRFTSLLEASCGSYCGRLPPILATNQGIIGYGTSQSLLQYLLTRDRRSYEAVVLALFTGNDLTDNAVVDSPSGPRPRLLPCDSAPEAGHLCLEGVPVPSAVDWPGHRLVDPRGGFARSFGWSGLATMASRRRAPAFLVERRIARQMDAAEALPFPIVERTSDAPVADPFGQLSAVVGFLNQAVRRDGRAFGVLVFPSALAYAGDAGERRNYRETVDILHALGVPVADYYEATGGQTAEELFFGSHGHWRPRGHQEAARLIRGLLTALTGRGS